VACRRYDLFCDLDQGGIALRLAHPVEGPIGRMGEPVLCQRAHLVIAGAYWNDEQDDRSILGALEQRGQLLRVDKIGSEKIGAQQQNAHAAAQQGGGDVAPPLAAHFDIRIRPDLQVLTGVGL